MFKNAFLLTGLPYSMKEAGFPLGVLLLFGVAYITGTVKAVCCKVKISLAKFR